MKNKTRKAIVTFYIFLFLMSSTLCVGASGNYSDQVFDETEYEEVLEVCEEYRALATEESTVYQEKEEFTGGFKRYVMDPGVFEYLITSGLPFEELVWKELEGSDRAYEWVVLFGNHAYFEIIHEEISGWIFNGLCEFDEAEIEKPEGTSWSMGLPDFNVISERKSEIEKAGEKLTEEEMIFILGTCQITFYAFRTDKNTYMIPFSWRPDFTGFTTGQCYKAEETVKILKETCSVIYADEEANRGEATAGGISAISEYTRKELSSPAKFLQGNSKEGPLPWIIGLSGVVILGILALVFNRKNSKAK